MKLAPKNRYFGCRGGWLTFWITVACGTDMYVKDKAGVNDVQY